MRCWTMLLQMLHANVAALQEAHMAASACRLVAASGPPLLRHGAACSEASTRNEQRGLVCAPAATHECGVSSTPSQGFRSLQGPEIDPSSLEVQACRHACTCIHSLVLLPTNLVATVACLLPKCCHSAASGATHCSICRASCRVAAFRHQCSWHTTSVVSKHTRVYLTCLHVLGSICLSDAIQCHSTSISDGWSLASCTC